MRPVSKEIMESAIKTLKFLSLKKWDVYNYDLDNKIGVYYEQENELLDEVINKVNNVVRLRSKDEIDKICYDVKYIIYINPSTDNLELFNNKVSGYIIGSNDVNKDIINRGVRYINSIDDIH